MPEDILVFRTTATMKNKKNWNELNLKSSRQLAIGLGILLAVIVALMFLLTQKNRDRIIEQNQRYLEDAALQSLKNMDEVFAYSSNSIALVAHLYELQLTEAEFDYRLLNSMTELTTFDFIRFVGMDGISYSGDGSQVNCKDREYYQEGVKGRSGICYIGASRFTGGQILIFYTPLYYKGHIIGVVNGVISSDRLLAQMQSSYFGETSKELLCLRDGTVVAAYGMEDVPENYLVRTKDTLPRKTWQDLEKAFREGRPYSYQYSEAKGVANAYAAPLAVSDFVLLQNFPSSASQAIVEKANRDALFVEIAIIVAFGLYLVLVITYYVHYNKNLSREKEELGQIVDSVKELYRRFVIFDLDNNTYEYLNEGNISLLGLPASGLYSDWFDAIKKRHDEKNDFWGDMADMTIEYLQQVLTKENWYTQREYAVPGDKWERLSLIKLDRDEEHTSRVLGAVEDITETKRKDEENRKALTEAFRAAESASRAKSDFLSRMSHDIRTPMNAVIGLTAIMGANLDNKDRLVDCLTKITSSSKHLLGLINEVLDMSKIESGKLVLSETEFSLSALVDDLLDIVQPMVRAKHQELSVEINDIRHEDVLGDNLRLQQVCVNILNNAVKYTEEGGHITLRVSELQSKQPLFGMYEFVFEDDGIGMSPEFMERLYTPFERAEDKRIANIQGTGLGMPIVQSIVHLMGGTISAESELGKGSRFTIRVNLKLQEVESAAEQQLIGLPVLVADDDQIACETTCLLLTDLGMQSEWVLSGREAVERVCEHHERDDDFFAVILDWKMPGMDGIATARAIRKEVGPDVPIIILSAYDWSEIEAEARQAGVNAFIGKPLFKSRLRGVFVNLVSETKTEPANPLEGLQRRDYSGKHILLAEDNELNQEIAKEILEMAGLTVDIAENGKVAVERFEASQPGEYDMIFMDIQMPVMNGYEATKAIRALSREDAAKIPIVAMTANTFNEDVVASRDAGMNQHIAKPLDMNQLTAALEKWLG